MAQSKTSTSENAGNENSAPAVPIGTAMVVGAGVAGIRSALDLAEVGYRVLLTDASPAIGGILSKLDYQFPNDHCGMCKMLPMVGREYASQYCMRKSLFHDNIKIMPFTEVLDVQGEPGAFTVKLREHARHVDTDVCIGTGYCAEACPIEVPDEFNQGLTRRKAIFQPVPHNLPNMYVIDMESCDLCGKCVDVCPVGAIDLEAADKDSEVEVDALVFAAGTGLYDPSSEEDLSSYSASPDVVTALEFERILSSSGKFDGVIHRPSDGKPARRIAWLQCVGSRNVAKKRDYCSSICCMFALKEAVLAHEKGGPDTETTIYYMDMRTFGKDFYRYREEAEQKHGVKLVRCRVHNVNVTSDGQLGVRYATGDGGFANESYDLVVLSTGQNARAETRKLSELLGVSLDASGHFVHEGFDKVKSPRDGVLMCGSFCGLSDISEALTSGSAAASEVSRLLAGLGRTYKGQPEFPPERPVDTEQPNVIVVLCRWNGGKMPQGIDMEPLREPLSKRAGVGQVEVIDTLCRGPGFKQAGELLANTSCNRVVFAACLPYIYRSRLKTLAQKAGLNPALVEVVDVRSTIQRHQAEKDQATVMRKVLAQLTTAIEKIKYSEALHLKTIPVEQAALVVGGGVAGMRAALSLADRGVEVHLVERRHSLGGRPVHRLHTTLEGLDPRAMARDLVRRAWEHKKITVHRDAEVIASNGHLGRFRSMIKNGDDKPQEVLHGATILATGGHEADTELYCRGGSDKVVTQAELEHRLAEGTIDPSALETVVMIQCVGSREKGEHDYCSRVCCAAALKNAAAIRAKNPDARVLVLYRDLMSYGASESFYTEARRQGVLFSTYDVNAKPKVELSDEGTLQVTFDDQVLHRQVQLRPDLLCLGTAVEPDATNTDLAELFKVELTEDGFFQEAESKWRPVDFLREGIFVAGTAHSPRPIVEAVSQAEAAAQRAYTYLSRREVTTARAVSSVRDALCARCQSCVNICPYEARTFDLTENRIIVDQAACQGCGMCAVACPNSAAEVRSIGEKQTMAVIEAALEGIGSTVMAR